MSSIVYIVVANVLFSGIVCGSILFCVQKLRNEIKGRSWLLGQFGETIMNNVMLLQYLINNNYYT